MEHAPAVGVGDRVADIDEPAEELAKRQRSGRAVRRRLASVSMEALDGFLQALAPDEPHGVERPSLVAGSQAVNGNHAGVLQPAGDLGLDQEARPAGRVIGVLGLNLLERDLAVQLRISGHEHVADASPSVMPQEPKSAPFRGRLTNIGASAYLMGIEEDCNPRPTVKSPPLTTSPKSRKGNGWRPSRPFSRLDDLWASWKSSPIKGEEGSSGARSTFTLPRRCGGSVHHEATLFLAECSLLDQDPGHRPGILLRPAPDRRDQVGELDQAALKGLDTEEQVAIGLPTAMGRVSTRASSV